MMTIYVPLILSKIHYLAVVQRHIEFDTDAGHAFVVAPGLLGANRAANIRVIAEKPQPYSIAGVPFPDAVNKATAIRNVDGLYLLGIFELSVCA